MDNVKDILDMLPYNMAKAYTDKVKAEQDEFLTYLAKCGGIGFIPLQDDGKLVRYTNLNLGQNGASSGSSPDIMNLIEGQNYFVVTETGGALCVCRYNRDGLYLGNGAFAFSNGEDTGESFVYYELSGRAYYTDDNGGETLIVSEFLPEFHTIDKLFLPKTLANTINLDKYGIGAVILGLFASGGGTQTVEGATDFWDAVSTDRSIEFKLSVNGDWVYINGITIVRSTLGSCYQIGFAVMLNYSGIVYSITVNIQRSGDDAIITVKVA